jgi:hypothetical protein
MELKSPTVLISKLKTYISAVSGLVMLLLIFTWKPELAAISQKLMVEPPANLKK